MSYIKACLSVVNQHLTDPYHNRSSSPDVPLVKLKKRRAAPRGESDSSIERNPDDKNCGQEHSQLAMGHFASPASSFPWPLTDALQPVLTSLDPSTISRPSHAAKRLPQVSSTPSLRSSSLSPQAKRRSGHPPPGCGGKQPAGDGRGQGKGWEGSKQPASPTAGYEDDSSSSTSANSTDVKESESADDGAEPHKQTTRNSAGTDHGSRRSFPTSCVRDMSSIHASRLSSPEQPIMPDPTTLVSQLNLTSSHAHPQQQLSPDIVPHLGLDPLSTPFESHPYLNDLEDPSSGIRFLGDIEHVIDGHFLESLTHGLYGPSTSSCLDSDDMPM